MARILGQALPVSRPLLRVHAVGPYLAHAVEALALVGTLVVVVLGYGDLGVVVLQP